MFFTEYLVHTRYLLAFLEKKTLYGSYFKQLLGILGRILNECRQIKEKEKISEMKIMFLPRGRRIWYKLTGVLLQRVHMDDWNGFKAWDQLLLVWQKKKMEIPVWSCGFLKTQELQMIWACSCLNITKVKLILCLREKWGKQKWSDSQHDFRKVTAFILITVNKEMMDVTYCLFAVRKLNLQDNSATKVLSETISPKRLLAFLFGTCCVFRVECLCF